MRRLTDEGRIVVPATHSLAVASRSDIVLTVGGSIASGPLGIVLTEAGVSDLYGTDLISCAACGQSFAATTHA
jgi:ABC-type cobalamin/Fe3+-siderophores transport system ATPase subunit